MRVVETNRGAAAVAEPDEHFSRLVPVPALPGAARRAHGIVGRSRAVDDMVRQIEAVAPARSTVLITGETGTGKELVARAIHDGSARRRMPFVAVNCAAIPDTLIESELFGHRKGAFTDATGTKRGKFSLADGGTIFLDEIGSMGMALQGKLLRVLQEREIEPLGAERVERIDVRVIAATNRDLRLLVADGRFLPDLFYRLHVVPISVPPLRERRDDIPLLVAHFVEKHAATCGKAIAGVDAPAMSALIGHDWPGNVRELENTIERAVVLSTSGRITGDVVTLTASASGAAASVPSLDLRQNVEWAEQETIRRALDVSSLKRQAAQLMGISPRALSHYLAKYPHMNRDVREDV